MSAGIGRVCVFCGSSPGGRPVYLESARALGTEIARRGMGLVYGGASIGLMGAVADSALAAGGEVIGVIPGAMERREIAHRGLTRLEVVASMHERKARMAELAGAFVALPGGLGTLEELAEMLTWAQLGIHRKPCAVLDVEGYWAPLATFLARAAEERFVKPEHRGLLLVGSEPSELLDRIASYTPVVTRKWIDAGQS